MCFCSSSLEYHKIQQFWNHWKSVQFSYSVVCDSLRPHESQHARPPCPGYCKQCCDEQWGTPVSFNSGFLGVYAQQWDCWIIWQFYFQLFKESPHCSP